MKNLVFIVVTYKPNQKELNSLVKILSALPVIVVDNTKNNLGYSGGANLGIQKAFKKEFDWLVFVNDDVRITKTALKEFLDIVKKSPPAIIGPFAGKIDPNRWTTIFPAAKMDYIDGAFSAVHSNVFQSVGTFYEPYFIYYEDIDLCVRAKRAKFPQRWFPIDGIYHEGSATIRKGSFLHQYYAARNHLLFVERQAPVRVKLYEFVRMPKTIVEHVAKRELAALLGIFHYFIRRFGKL